MFSVLLSLYIKEQPFFLKQSLDSLLSQTLLPSEIILVKDGALTPELDAVVSDYKRCYPILKVVALKQNQGLGKALNEGLKHCSYDLVARMDTDDIAKPDRFEKQLKVFQEHPELDVVGTWIDEFEDDTSHVASIRKLPEHHDEIVKYAKHRCPINHPVVMYRKSKVLAVGGYTGFPEDYCLWIKMLMNGARFYNLQESLLWFRFSSDVVKRRGGWSYAKSDVKSQINFYKMGFLNIWELFYNIIIRLSVRLIPDSCRMFVYRKLLRR